MILAPRPQDHRRLDLPAPLIEPLATLVPLPPRDYSPIQPHDRSAGQKG